MRKIVFLLFTVLICTTAIAQNDFISDSRYEEADRAGNLDGEAGILVVSAQNDLIISITNVPEGSKAPSITPKGKGPTGLYEYEIVIDKKNIPQPKVEVRRRGDVRSTSFVSKLTENYFIAYLVEEVVKKIRQESMQSATDAVLDANSAEIELTSSVEGLKVETSPLLQATIKSERHKADANITVFTIRIPISVFNEADAIYKTILDTYKADTAAYNRAEEEHKKGMLKSEKLLELMNKAENSEDALSKILAERQERCSIILYAEGSNKLVIDFGESLAPRQKLCYGIMPMEKEVHVSECSGYLKEGGRQFALRHYDEAKRAFNQALTAKDTPTGMITAIKNNIAQCDTCLQYEKLAMYSLRKMKEARDKGSVSQEDVVNFSSGALEFIEVLNKYNPCEFYSSRINQLNSMIKDLPLSLRFNIVKWVKSKIGFSEGGAFSNVEVWAYYGSGIPSKDSYQTKRKFKKLTTSYNYRCLGTTNNEGQVELNLKRSELPTGFMFNSIFHKDECDIVYFDAKDIMSKAKGTYNKRQFRIRMAIKDK